MVGRLVEVEGVDPTKREEIMGIIREQVIPGLKEIDGFAGFIALVDQANRRTRTVVLWETSEGAEEAERRFAAKREEAAAGAPAARSARRISTTPRSSRYSRQRERKKRARGPIGPHTRSSTR